MPWFNKLGDIRLEVNDVAGAELAYREGLDVVRSMLTVDPDTTLWHDDLALALAGVGQIHMRRTENREAREIFLEAIQIERKLDHPKADDRLLRNLQNHLGFLGDVHVRLNERKEARAIFEERLRIRRRRHLADRQDPDLLADVSVALDRVGQLLRDEGNTVDSRSHFEEALGIDGELTARFPDRRAFQENLVEPFKDGRPRWAGRPVASGVEALRRGIADPAQARRGLRRADAATDPGIAPGQDRQREATPEGLCRRTGGLCRRDRVTTQDHRPRCRQARRMQGLSIALDGYGLTLRESGDLDGARAAFSEQLQIDRDLEKQQLGNTDRLIDLAWSLNRIGDPDRDLKRYEEAAKPYNEALLIQQRLMVRFPGNSTRMRALAAILDKLANVRVRLRQLDAARVSMRSSLVGVAS